MSNCTNCWHPLVGVPGAPTEVHGAFPADCRCPECGAVTPAGARVFAGTRDPLALGTRWSVGKVLLVLFVLGALYLNGSDFLIGLIAALRGESGALDAGFAGDFLLTLLLGATLFRLVAWSFVNSRRTNSAQVTAALTGRVAWMFVPGRVVVFAPPDGAAVAVEGADPPSVTRPFELARSDAGPGEPPLPPSAKFLIDPADVRTVDAKAERAARNFKGNIVRLSLRPARVPRDWPGAIYLATDHTAVQIASLVREALRVACPQSGEAAQASSEAATPEPAPPQARTGIDADMPASSPWCVLTPEMVELRGRPFEPRLVADADPAVRSDRLQVVFLLTAVVGAIAVGRNFRTLRGLAFGISIVCVFGVVRVLYRQHRSTTVRWQATPGVLRIDRYRYLFMPIWPTTRLMSGESIEAVRVVERDGMPMLEVFRRNRRKPAAVLLPDDLGPHEPAAVAAAIESMVRRKG